MADRMLLCVAAGETTPPVHYTERESPPVKIESPKKAQKEEGTEQRGSDSGDDTEQTTVISFTVAGVTFLIIVACVGYALERDSEKKAGMKEKIRKRLARSSRAFSF